MPSYADITTEDPNRVKRWLQSRRLDDALWHLGRTAGRDFDGRLLDFGGGDGALCRRFLARYPGAEAVSFDPSATMLAQASASVGDGRMVVAGSTASFDAATFDVVTCCEVFEHPPAAQVDDALREIARLLRPDGTLVLGVPNELYLMALGKGVFRMARRNGEYDARWDTVLPATKGRPRADRPEHEIDGHPFIYPHTGFDYRDTRRDLARHGFRVVATYGSPLRRGPMLIRSEIYLVCRRADAGGAVAG